MFTFLAALQVIAAIVLVSTVLLQPAKSDGNAFGPSSNTAMGNSGGTTFLFKATMFCAAFLAVSSLYATWSNLSESKRSVIDELALPLTPDMAPAVPPAAGESPATQSGEGN